MTTNSQPVNALSIAPLRNVVALLTMTDMLQARPAGLSGLGVFSGFSGYGKSVASQYVMNKLGAKYVEARSFWTQKAFCEALLKELNVDRPKGTISKMMDEIIDIMGDDPRRPLIIDEADKLVDKNMIELVRDIHETTGVPIILVGEENLPNKLKAFERVDNRVLGRVLAEKCDTADAQHLAKIRCPGIALAPDLLAHIVTQTKGNARRIATTLHNVKVFAINEGVRELDLAAYRGGVFTGEALKRGVA
ncbi:ATP-binding protein [Devosia sp. J2-20]|uniref:AAA family ATPase n=1 Tax=Devosia sp. J2-20 TaxID=3026161 RepID=UPI00249C41CA|nr:ATP-binding protein [Devosia sp. J2-20]WDR00719.1 ATP-binding protein [Devosia sp. J2-20]